MASPSRFPSSFPSLVPSHRCYGSEESGSEPSELKPEASKLEMDSMNATRAKVGNMMKQEGHTTCACAMATDSATWGNTCRHFGVSTAQPVQPLTSPPRPIASSASSTKVK
uniref:Uncharacterized protein n=1 Tax=Oryza glumipatula TaxID=40148 RepID=A0A0E0ATI6_9ORYZ